MRYFKIILFCFYAVTIINTVLSQKIAKGTYKSYIFPDIDPITHKETHYMTEYYESIKILNDSLFEYTYWTDIGSDIGRGYYRLYDDDFILNFKKFPEKYDTIDFKILKSKPSKGDSVYFDFSIIDAIDFAPVKYAIIIARNCDTNAVKNRNNFGCETDENGHGKLNIPKIALPCVVTIQALWYTPYKIFLDDNSSKTIEIRMKNRSRIILEGTVIKYLIKNINNQGFYLFGGIWNTWTYFMKMN